MTPMFWDSQEAPIASEEVANKLRGDAVAATEGRIAAVEHYEVVLDDAPVPANGS
jgi:hypothetical protein